MSDTKSLADRAVDAVEDGFEESVKTAFRNFATDPDTFSDHFKKAVHQLAQCRELALSIVSKNLG